MPISEKAASIMANRILRSDSSVYFLSVVGELGQVIWQETNKIIPEEVLRLAPSQTVAKNYGAQVAVISSIFKLAENLLGESKFIISVYENLTLVIMPTNSRKYAMIALISNTADAKAVAQKIHEAIYSS